MQCDDLTTAKAEILVWAAAASLVHSLGYACIARIKEGQSAGSLLIVFRI
jgi:hypothetical protein